MLDFHTPGYRMNMVLNPPTPPRPPILIIRIVHTFIGLSYRFPIGKHEAVVTEEAMRMLSRTKELCYLTSFVIRLFEDMEKVWRNCFFPKRLFVCLRYVWCRVTGWLLVSILFFYFVSCWSYQVSRVYELVKPLLGALLSRKRSCVSSFLVVSVYIFMPALPTLAVYDADRCRYVRRLAHCCEITQRES